jgi:hypothetical protein
MENIRAKFRERKNVVAHDLSTIEKPLPLETYKLFQKFIHFRRIKDQNYLYSTLCQNLLIMTLFNPLLRIKTILQVSPSLSYAQLRPKSTSDSLKFALRGLFPNLLITSSTIVFHYLYRPFFFSSFNTEIAETNRIRYFLQMFQTMTYGNIFLNLLIYPLERWRTLIYTKDVTNRPLISKSMFTNLYMHDGLYGAWRGFKLMTMNLLFQNGLFTGAYYLFRVNTGLSQEVSVSASILLAGTLVYPFDTQLKRIQNEMLLSFISPSSPKHFSMTLAKVLLTPVRESFAGYPVYLIMNLVTFWLLRRNSKTERK